MYTPRLRFKRFSVNIPIITTQHIPQTYKKANKETIDKEKRFRNFRLVKVSPSQYSRNGK